MKKRNSLILVLILAILGGAIFVGLKGVSIGGKKIGPARDQINLGLELAGGVYVVLEADTDASGEELHQMMEQTRTIISKRVDGLGVSEPNISIENENRIRVELAGVEDPQEAIELIGKTAQLQFVNYKGDIVLTGKNVKKSEVKYQDLEMGQREIVVGLEFDEEGKKSFADATEELIYNEKPEERVIYILLDGEIISAPLVDYVGDGGKPLKDGNAVIRGGFDFDSAVSLSNLISAGALPVEMIERTTSVIGPTLGLEAFDKSIKAGAVGLLAIFIYMIIMYKLPGLVSVIGIIIYTILVSGTMSLLGVVLTLPGIAGLVLSIGMAVDANVLIFERIREEIKNGKTVRTSIDSGFKRALTSVIDSNITTFIAGLVLYYFGEGPIKGFGVTLIIGIIASMITSVFITKAILKLFYGIIGEDNTKIYGA